jgi:putative Holliday junction resolvase
VLRTDDDSALQALREIVRREQIGGLVVGEPRRLDGTRGAAAERAATFARKLVAASGLPCEMVDEALTSVEARQRLRAAGVDPRQHPERVDSLAAQILLQEALDRRRGS